MEEYVTTHGTGNKYHRTVNSVDGTGNVVVDVYAVLAAFNVTCPARQHAIKKLLCAGIRGKGDELQDLKEAQDALDRAVAMAGGQQDHPTTESSGHKVEGCLLPKPEDSQGVIQQW